MKENEDGANLPSFISAKNYSDFISNDLRVALTLLFRLRLVKYIGHIFFIAVPRQFS